jgi:CMP-N,N'-diacetyllegionaminic acid synthase
MKVLAIIPARAGSKGIPGKNVKKFFGKPLIEYSIESAIESKEIDEIIVSSDDERIEQICKKYSQVIFKKRKLELASDTSPITDTIIQILRDVDLKKYDTLLLLQPTSPIRDMHHIDDAIRVLEENLDANSVISVTKMDDIHPARMYLKNENNHLTSFLPQFEYYRRQEIPPALYRNGCIYLVRISEFLKTKSFFSKPILGYEMSPDIMLNIDTYRDLLIAESIIKAWKEGKIG